MCLVLWDMCVLFSEQQSIAISGNFLLSNFSISQKIFLFPFYTHTHTIQCCNFFSVYVYVCLAFCFSSLILRFIFSFFLFALTPSDFVVVCTSFICFCYIFRLTLYRSKRKFKRANYEHCLRISIKSLFIQSSFFFRFASSFSSTCFLNDKFLHRILLVISNFT